MKRNLLIAVLAVSFLAAGRSFALTGVGASVGISPLGGLPGSNVMLSLKLEKVPMILGLGFAVGSNQFGFGVTADYWAVHEKLFSLGKVPFNYYLGPGAYVGYGGSLSLGGRLPIGLDVYPIKNFEAFIEIAPTLVIQFANPIKFPVFGLQSAFGVRFWF
jgi:hypothetical protein